MSKHTPEPWSTEYRERHDGMFAQEIIDANGETIAILTWHPVRTPTGITTDRQANARRIVACVNACAGLSTDELERFGLASALGSEIVELKNQRDQIFHVLGLAVSAMEDAVGHIDAYEGGDVYDRVVRDLHEAITICRATKSESVEQQWICCSIRLPEPGDADGNGDVLWLRSGVECLGRVSSGVPVDATHWRKTGRGAS